jgi:hypothetical protein
VYCEIIINILTALPMSPAPNEIWYTNGNSTEATFPSNLEAFDAKIISNLYNFENKCWVITFDNHLSSIGQSAFSGCTDLTGVKLPDSIKSIEAEAFGWCENLLQVITGEGIIKIGDFAFRTCKKLKSVTLGNNLLTIGDYAFYYCRKLTKISIPHSVFYLGRKAFKYCYELSHIDLGMKLRIIGEEAFSDCRKLTDIIIPYSVGIIESKAFYSCPISTVQCMPKTPPLGFYDIDWDNEPWYLFFNHHPDFKLYVQPDSLDQYKASEQWGQYSNNIIVHDFRKKGKIR